MARYSRSVIGKRANAAPDNGKEVENPPHVGKTKTKTARGQANPNTADGSPVWN